MARATQPVIVDDISFDALIEESMTYSADVPSYPTEAGFDVSDTIILKPLTLSMTLFLTNTPVTWRERHGADTSRVRDVIRKLEQLYFSRQPVTVSTSDKTYENMAIVSIELSKTKETGSSREIPITFQEIRVTESRTTTIPDSYGKSGATGANAGTANTTAGETPASGKKGSVLHGMAYGGAQERWSLGQGGGLFGG